MTKLWMRCLALCLCAVLALSSLAGCKPQETEAPAATEPAQEAKVLKVLTLGNSLAVDTGHMLNLICGTVAKGLSGIWAVRGCTARPFLQETRERLAA